MAVAFDANSAIAFTTTDPQTFTHTPVGTPKGVLVFCLAASASDLFSGVTYGGVSMTAVSGGAAVDTAGEVLYTKAYFLGSSIPTGAQTVSVDADGSATSKGAYCVTVTASGDTVISGTPVLVQEDGTVAEQNVDTSGTTALRFAAIYSGQNSAPTAGANSTSIDSGGGIGASRSHHILRETTGGSGSRPVGGSSGTTDDRANVHLAIAEAAANVTVTPSTASLTLTTFAPTVTATAGVTATPTTAGLTLATFAPTVTTTANVTATPTTATLNLTMFAPTVTATGAFAQGVGGFMVIG